MIPIGCRLGGETWTSIDTGKVYESIKQVEEELGLSHSNLVACCAGRRPTCGGLHWEYA